jgi:hypothetical protein
MRPREKAIIGLKLRQQTATLQEGCVTRLCEAV